MNRSDDFREQIAMRLYSLPGSRYGSRCAIQISAKDLNIPIELLPVPIPKDFTAINATRLVPVLEVDGKFLPESQVICEYLEDICDGVSLRPEDPFNCAKMRLMIRQFELYYDPSLLEIYRLLQNGKKFEAKRVRQFADNVRHGIDLISSNLSGERYAVGGKLSLADCALMPPFLQTKLLFPQLGLEDPIAANAVSRQYYTKTLDDPHISKILDEMNPHLVGWFSNVACP